MRRFIICLLFVFVSLFCVHTQDLLAQTGVQSPLSSGLHTSMDSTRIYSNQEKIGAKDTLKVETPFVPKPKTALLIALVPGMGQIYNRKYWKLPIIYGGFIGLTYAITWNGKYYNQYSSAYKSSMASDPYSPENAAVWGAFLPYGVTTQDVEASGNLPLYQSAFKRQKDMYRRQRDLSIIGAVALYGITIVDAYVDAQLFDFDISPNLSMHLGPTLMDPSPVSGQALGLQCSIRF